MKKTDTVMDPVKLVQIKANKEKTQYFLLSIAGIAFFLLIWQILATFNIIDKQLITTPVQVMIALVTKLTNPAPDGNTLFVNIGSSLLLALMGFTLAIAVGTPLGLLMGWYEPVDKFVRPVFEVLRPIPPIAWIPLTILLLGIGLFAKSFIIFFSAFVPTVINSYTGIKLTNPVLINVAKTYGATNRQIFVKVGIPSALPMVFAGYRISLGNSWSTLVAAEMLASNQGLGYMILIGRQFMRIDVIILGMIVIGIIGAVLAGILSGVENKFVKGRARR